MSAPNVFQRNPNQELDDIAKTIVQWILRFVSEVSNLRPDQIKAASKFEDFGLDSSATVRLSVELSEWLGRDVEPILAYEYPTVSSLAQHLAGELLARPA